MRSIFLRMLEETHDKERALRAAIREPDLIRGTRRFDVDPMSFSSVPRSPFSYWISDALRSRFVEGPLFEDAGRTAQFGAVTTHDFRFLRAWWAVSPSQVGSKWRLFSKGGVFSPFYSDVHLTVLWGEWPTEIDAVICARYDYLKGNSGWLLHPESSYFRPGLTWPLRTKSRLSLRALPAGCVFGHKGPSAFIQDNGTIALLALLAVTASRSFYAFVEVQLAAADAKAGGAAHSFELGVMRATPVPSLNPADEAILAAIARQAWSLRRSLDTRNETSHAFVLPALLMVDGKSLAGRAAMWSDHVRNVEAELGAIQADIDDRCFQLYGIDDADRQAITRGFGANAIGLESAEAQPKVGAENDDEGEDDDEPETAADTTALAAELVSWAVGVAFGRFDIRMATGERHRPTEPEPFDPLPVCSPGMLTGDDGLPLASPPVGYPLSFPDDGILVDDPGHQHDLTAAVRAVFEVVFGSLADSMWQEVAALLDPRGHDLRQWLASGFFEHHLRCHSKSRRKAPILWQLGIPSGRYSAWCYAHRMTRDSLLSIQNDIVGPKLATEERRLSSLITQAGQTPSARERTDIATQQSFIEELRTLLDEVRRVAPLWNPDLNDGVVLVIAPLWRLVPTHKAWQKELHTKWDELVAGKYDWAHVAMHLWPERVVPKCATDRSFAIAHGIEDVFWAESNDGKWTARKRPTRPIADLIAERTSPAIKDALASFADSPSPIRGGKRNRNSRQTF